MPKSRHNVEIDADIHLELQNLHRASGFSIRSIISLAVKEWAVRHCTESTVVGQALRSIRDIRAKKEAI